MSNITNKKGLNEAIVRAAKRDWYSGSGEARNYSVTQLLNPPKIYHLMKRHEHEIDEDVAERMFMLMGSAMHAILERANEHDVEFTILSRVRAFFEKLHNGEISKDPDEIEQGFLNFMLDDPRMTNGRLGYLLSLLPEYRFLIEKRFKYVTNKGLVISGGIDLYDKETKILHDYKFSSVWTWIYRNSPGSRLEEWTQQMNMYRYFMEKQGYTVNKLNINLLMRDYSKSKARQERNYPEQIETIELPLLGFDIIEQMIENKVDELERYALTRDDSIPFCTAHERWQQRDSYAVIKKGNKIASRVEYSYAAAKSWIDAEAQKIAEKKSKGESSFVEYDKARENYYIETRPGIPTRCESYCSVAKFCNFWQEYKKKLDNK